MTLSNELWHYAGSNEMTGTCILVLILVAVIRLVLSQHTTQRRLLSKFVGHCHLYIRSLFIFLQSFFLGKLKNEPRSNIESQLARKGTHDEHLLNPLGFASLSRSTMLEACGAELLVITYRTMTCYMRCVILYLCVVRSCRLPRYIPMHARGQEQSTQWDACFV